MALTLIKEDGTGRSDANAYANAADGDAYQDGQLVTESTADDFKKVLNAGGVSANILWVIAIY